MGKIERVPVEEWFIFKDGSIEAFKQIRREINIQRSPQSIRDKVCLYFNFKYLVKSSLWGQATDHVIRFEVDRGRQGLGRLYLIRCGLQKTELFHYNYQGFNNRLIFSIDKSFDDMTPEDLQVMFHHIVISEVMEWS